MTGDIEKRFALNTAQLRNLRNWAVEQWPGKTLVFAVRPPQPISVDVARQAFACLVRRHEATRSRLGRDSVGARVQEVLTADAAEARVSWEVTEHGEQLKPRLVDPELRACHFVLHLRDGQVDLVELSVSHVFTDGFGARALVRDLEHLLADMPLPHKQPQQASWYVSGEYDEKVRDNTEYWQRILRAAPRSCTYSATVRGDCEPVQIARVRLAPEDDEQIISLCRKIRVTPYSLWAAAISALVSRFSGQHSQVFRSTYANRFTPADFGAVAQLAQAVYVPIDGTGTDSLQTRAKLVARYLLRTLRRGTYDANSLLSWLNSAEVCRGAIFQPAFELNYLPARGGQAPVKTPDKASEIVEVQIDPPSAKADLAVTVSHVPGSMVQLSARRPVNGQRSAQDLVTDYLLVLRQFWQNPDMPIADLPVEPFPATASLLPGHHSGVWVDQEMTCRLVLSVPGVKSCDVRIRQDSNGIGELYALIRVSVLPPDLHDLLRDRQPWFSGSVVPDHIAVLEAGRA